MVSRTQEKSGASSVGLVARVLLAQLGLSVVLAALFWGMAGSVSGYSALLGGLTCVVPNAFLALRLALSGSDREPGGLVRAAWIGEVGKLVLTVLMFTIVFTLVEPLEAGPLFGGFIAAQLMTLGGFLMRDDGRLKNRVLDTSNKNGE